MGNCFSGRKHLVQPAQERREQKKVKKNPFPGTKQQVHPSDQPNSPSREDLSNPSGGVRRIKMRMTAEEFRELLRRAATDNAEGGVVGLIAEEYLKRRGGACSVGDVESDAGNGNVIRLESIPEEE